MKRTIALLLMLVLLVVATGCGSADVSTQTAEGDASPEQAEQAEQSALAASAESIPTDGPGESAAAAALPRALEEGRAMREGAGLDWPDLSGLEPAFTAYIIIVDMDGQGSLFEVRADGVPHSLYAYQRAFDAATILWSPSEYSGSPRTAPQSATETAAVAAVESAMRDSFPDAAMSVTVYGYRFVYSADGAPVMTLEIATDGSVISAG